MKAEQTLSSTDRQEPDRSVLAETLPPGFPEGVLPDGELENAIRHGWITAGGEEIPEASIQPASLDLRLGATAYRLRSSFLPGSKTVQSRLREHQIGPEIPLSGDGAVLERNRPYLVRLMERMNLPPRLSARANPKSSTGRLDIFTRVVVDNGTGFDEIPEAYSGPVYLEVVSRSFTVQVREGLSLNQVRLVHGDKRVSSAELHRKHARSPLLYAPGMGNRPADVSKGVFLTVDLLGDADGRVGYRAKKNSALLDLSKRGEYRAEDFWEPVESIRGNRLILEPEEFYLLVSSERVAVNEDLAAELAAYDPTSGELRTHYAGFFDPGFGYPPTDQGAGSRAVLEVRAHDVPFALEHGQRIARLEFETMAKPPTKLYGPDIGSSYQNQELWLSKHFRSQRPREQSPKDQMSLFPE
jgi:dCTP deaminase